MAVPAEEAATHSCEDAVRVRDATRDDMPTVHAMIHELAKFEGMPEGPELAVEDLITDGFESHPSWFFALVAERRGAVVGYALCNRAYSSWTRRAMYLEDLYVAPGARRAGVGLALLRTLCQLRQCQLRHQYQQARGYRRNQRGLLRRRVKSNTRMPTRWRLHNSRWRHNVCVIHRPLVVLLFWLVRRVKVIRGRIPSSGWSTIRKAERTGRKQRCDGGARAARGTRQAGSSGDTAAMTLAEHQD